MTAKFKINRRHFIAGTSLGALSVAMPAISRAASRPEFTHGVQTGDVDTHSGMIWTRVDRPARVEFEWATSESFANPVRLAALDTGPQSDFTVKRLLSELPSDQEIFWRATATDLDNVNARSEPVTGRFRTAPRSRRNIRFAWSGDTVGQGWGINEDDGGMRSYRAMAEHDLDFFLHSGDTVYSDGPLEEKVELEDGTIWRNLVTPEKSKVAETLNEYRGQWKYNMLDANVRDMNARVPTFFQWDDHEVVNNWSAAKDLREDDRYTEKNVGVLTARAARAFSEMTPIRYVPEEPGRVYRTIHYGPLLDIFIVDLRSYRGANGDNDQDTMSEASAILGKRQMEWLKRSLSASKATWKVIASDMPLGLVVKDGERFEAVANDDPGSPKGREMEIAKLLSFIRAAAIENVVWLTADVHYTAAHHYSPDRAKFQDFVPFWEFVSGPIHAGTFGPNKLDMTFGPEVRFVKAPGPDMKPNLPPSAGYQFFGLVDIDGASAELSVRLMDRDNQELWKTSLKPA